MVPFCEPTLDVNFYEEGLTTVLKGEGGTKFWVVESLVIELILAQVPSQGGVCSFSA